jgi:RNA polymerase sigma factor (sigma-70 family)
MEEKDLINKVINGSYESFTELYNCWVSRLYNFVFSLVKSEDITQDIVQETFVKIWTNRTMLSPEYSFKSYLFTISYHLSLKEFKHVLNHPLLEDYMLYNIQSSSDDSAVESQLDFNNFLVKLGDAKQKLTARQREVFEMNKEYNIPIKEIAARLSINEQSVRNHLATALKIIRDEMKDYYFLLLLFFCH